VAQRLLESSSALDAPALLLLDTAGKAFEESRAPGTQSLRNEAKQS